MMRGKIRWEGMVEGHVGTFLHIHSAIVSMVFKMVTTEG